MLYNCNQLGLLLNHKLEIETDVKITITSQ